VIDAAYFNGRHAAADPVVVSISADRLRVHGAAVDADWPIESVDIAQALGASPRWLHFVDGSSCEVTDTDAFERAWRAAGLPLDRVTRWQRNRALVGMSLAGLFSAVVFIYLVVVPPVADGLAQRLPASTLAVAGDTTRAFLDQSVLKPTTLSRDRQHEIRTLLYRLPVPLDPDRAPLALEFRSSEDLGPNALALPSGLIIMTDELVAVSTDDDALMGILAHEVGHILRRHSLRQVIQDSSAAMLLAGVLGDVNSVVLLLPARFLTVRHTRAFETEADDFAVTALTQLGVATAPMADLLDRIAAGGPDLGYLATHPPTPERVERLRTGAAPAGGLIQ
jgi:Zn-dependent protease with chaperone function